MIQASSWNVHRRSPLSEEQTRLFDALEIGDTAALMTVLGQGVDPNVQMAIDVDACDDQGVVVERWSERHTPLSWAVGCSASESALNALLDAGAQGAVPGIASVLPGVLAAKHWAVGRRLLDADGANGLSEDDRLLAFQHAWDAKNVDVLSRMVELAWTDYMDVPPDEAQRLRALPKEHRLMDTVSDLAREAHLPDGWEARLDQALQHDLASLNVPRQAFTFRTPLATAVVANHAPLVERLVQAGADVRQTVALQVLSANSTAENPVHAGRDDQGNTVFFNVSTAMRAENRAWPAKVHEVYVEWHDNAISPLYLAASLGHVPLSQKLLDLGADLDQRSTNTCPWRLAAANFDLDSRTPDPHQLDMPFEELQERRAPYQQAGGLRVLDVLKIQGMLVEHNQLESHVLHQAMPPTSALQPSSSPRL